MESWSIGLFQNDTAADVKMVVDDHARRPIDTETLVARVLGTFDCGAELTREDAADIWPALADLLHRHALEPPALMEETRHLIAEDADLAMKEDLGRVPRDLEKRARLLEEALARCAVPTRRHAARPFHGKSADPAGFASDGWGLFAVACLRIPRLLSLCPRHSRRFRPTGA